MGLMVVGIGGSMREDSQSERALGVVLDSARAAGAETVAITGTDLVLPFYDPAVVERSEVAHRLVATLREADGVALGWQATVTTLTALRSIVHALRGWPTPLGAALNSAQVSFDEHGVPSDPAVDRTLRVIGQQVVQFALGPGSTGRWPSPTPPGPGARPD